MREQTSCDVLRQITRFLYLAKKLRSHLDAQRLPEAAECLYELGNDKTPSSCPLMKR
jgi:hypothetical protein